MDHVTFAQLLGSYGEFLGSIAVFATLVYLAVQVRYTKSELRRSISQERAAASIQLQQNRVANEALRKAYLKTSEPRFLSDYTQQFDITIEEADMLVWDRVAYWQYHSHTIAHIDELPPDERVAFDVALRAQYTSPFVAAWYKRSKDFNILSEGAVRYIDNLLGELGPSSDSDRKY